jgi:hypothetical protein
LAESIVEWLAVDFELDTIERSGVAFGDDERFAI